MIFHQPFRGIQETKHDGFPCIYGNCVRCFGIPPFCGFLQENRRLLSLIIGLIYINVGTSHDRDSDVLCHAQTRISSLNSDFRRVRISAPQILV